MAVYKRTYHGYHGPLTPTWSRFLVLPRYSFEAMRKNRLLTIFFMVSCFWPMISSLVIYLNHNISALKLLKINASQVVNIDSSFFLTFLGLQSMMAFFLAALGGPGLISPDLLNNALPLYLARPFSRAEYVLGKASVLLILLSIMTWIPGLGLFLLEGYWSGASWMWDNLRTAGGLFLGAWIWILVLTLMALALSAWVRLKHIGAGVMFIVFFVAAGFGEAINQLLRTKWGHLINISHLIGSVWVHLFDKPIERGTGAVFFRIKVVVDAGQQATSAGEQLPIWACWMGLFGICAVCLYMLSLKIRGAEVVK